MAVSEMLINKSQKNKNSPYLLHVHLNIYLGPKNVSNLKRLNELEETECS